MEQSTERPGGAWAERVARWGTGALVALAFWTSFTHLADVARRSGVPRGQAWVWPSMIDGSALIATVAALTMTQNRGGRRYAWGVVWANLVLSLAGNIGSVLMPTGPMPLVVRVVVACIPPAELMVCLHLALIQTGRRAVVVASVERPALLREPRTAPVHGAVHDVAVERAAPVDVERAPVHPVPAAPRTAPRTGAPVLDVAAAESSGAVRVTATVPDDEREPAREPAGNETARVERFTEWVREHEAEHGVPPSNAAAGAWLGASKSTGRRWLAKVAAQRGDVERGELGGPLHVEAQDHDGAAVVSGAYERIGA